MALESLIGFKIFRAIVTLEFQALMSHHVVLVVPFYIEPFSTDVTVMCKVSRVQLHVLPEITFRCVSFITQSAGKVVAIIRVPEASSSRLYLTLNTMGKTGDHYHIVKLV